MIRAASETDEAIVGGNHESCPVPVAATDELGMQILVSAKRIDFIQGYTRRDRSKLTVAGQ